MTIKCRADGARPVGDLPRRAKTGLQRQILAENGIFLPARATGTLTVRTP